MSGPDPRLRGFALKYGMVRADGRGGFCRGCRQRLTPRDPLPYCKACDPDGSRAAADRAEGERLLEEQR